MRIKALLIVFLTFSSYLFSQQLPDTGFTVNISKPAFNKENAPKILIDAAHNNLHTKNTGFAALTKLLEQDGFTVNELTKEISTKEDLKNCDILVIANALHASDRGAWITPNPSAFKATEIEIINTWVKNGGALLVIADHMPFGGAIQDLAKSFGIIWENNFVGANGQNWPPNTFSKKAKTLKTPKSWKSYYPIDTVATFTGSSLQLPKKGFPILVLEKTDTAYYPDTAWRFANAKRKSLKGQVQGGCLKHGKGKVMAFAEAAMFTAQLADGIYKVGFNSPNAPQNAMFVLNVFYDLANRQIEDKSRFKEPLKIHY